MEHMNDKRRITPAQWFSWALMVASPFLLMGLMSLTSWIATGFYKIWASRALATTACSR